MPIPKRNSYSNDLIKEFRFHIGHLLSFTLTDLDCLRFLHARKCSIESSVELALKWDEWRHKLLDALPRTALRYSPNILLASYSDYFFSHPKIDLLPCLHHGWDDEGRPILWVKLGYIQSHFTEILKHFSIEDLTQYHLVIQEMFELRYDYMYTQHNKTITNSVVILDMAGFDRVTLDMDAVWMLKSWIHLEQNYYPERLHQMYIVNTPWYFSSLLGMFQPFIDKKTRKKIKIFQGDYLSALTQHIDLGTIPEEYGGNSAVTYEGSHSELSGVSLLQIEAFVRQELFSPESTRVTTPEEDRALREMVKRNRVRRRRKDGISDQDREDEPDDEATLTSIYYSATSACAPADGGAVAAAGAGMMGGAIRNSDLAIEMTYMSSVFDVSISGVENLPSHDEYVVDICYNDKIKWQVRHRYSEFDKFRKKIQEILPPSARKILPLLPPKTIFGKRSAKVVKERREKLSIFLSSLLSQIRSEATFDGVKLSSRREEEHQLFLFLEAYKALQSYVEDTDFTSDDEGDDDVNEEEFESDDENDGSRRNLLSFRDRQQLVPLHIADTRNRILPLQLSSRTAQAVPHGGPLDSILHTRTRRVSAALLSVCVLVMSLVGNVYRMQNS